MKPLPVRSLCLFACYFSGADLPYYIEIYLKELKRHFFEVILVAACEKLSQASIEFLSQQGIKWQLEDNEGFDFGLWYKALLRVDALNYDQLVLVNDSCILFKPLDDFMAWQNKTKADFLGMTKSEAIAPHLQSYFLVVNKPAMPMTLSYFKEHKIVANLQNVIGIYELGLSSFLIKNAMKIAAFVDNNGYNGEFAPYYYCVDHHISKGLPLIKKKIIFSSYRKDELFTLARMNFKINSKHYIRLIESSDADLIIDFKQLKPQKKPLGFYDYLKYVLTRTALNFLHLFLKRKSQT
jgi:lipopolysaccharide biosynthesis protein